ncbi:MAG TPA: gfo/Idh/MocA family oxidoreductase, partial [Verrucomicrobiales bacterium]|nr:gfo/Idh/MocA family oxidoreductase [Verrucomicrobiales bacterium]
SYERLCRQIAKFFRTGVPPVSEAETVEIFTFMEAADESVRQGGKAVALADVLAKARVESAKLVRP